MKTIYNKLLFLLLLVPFSVLAQNTVEGVVVDAKSKQPLPGVNVIVQGTTTGTSTDFDGKFKLTKIKKGDKLVFSFVGYKNETIEYNNEKSITVSLDEEANQLQEVVVQVGYGSVKKKDATGSVEVLSTKDFNRGFNSNVEGLLNGRSAGVVVTQGGRPGDGAAIRIRGGASLSASNDPLIVLDGMPLANGNLSSINPNDIETMSILKDASATAIYGNRGSNGVILITTKKGAKGAVKVNVGTTFTVNTLAEKIKTTSATDFRNFITNPANIAQYNIAPARLARLGNSDTDWQEEIFSNSVSIDNNVALRGSLFGKLPAAFSYGHTYVPGILETSKFDRTTTSLRLNPSFFKDHLKIAVNANFTVSKNRFADEGAISDAINFDPTQPVNVADPTFGGYFEWIDSANQPIFLATDNPVSKLQQRDSQNKDYRYFGNIQLDYKFHFLPELKATVIAGLDRTQGRGYTTLTNTNISGFFNSGVNLGRYSYGTGESTQHLLDAYLNYNKTFGKINVDFTAGHSYQENRNESFNSGETYDPNNVINSLDYILYPVRKLESYFGRANLGYDGKYLLTLNLRNDITNNFSPENRSGIFPGAAFAWVISKESFMSNSKAINNLKLRLGWGVTGQQDLETNFSYIPKYLNSNQGSQYQFGNTIISPVAPSFYFIEPKWEETTTINAGLDFDLYKKVKGSLDVYKKESKDLLAYVAFPDGANFTNFGPRNFGNLVVQGIELALNTDLIKNDNV